MDAAEDRMWWYRALHERLIDSLADISGPVLDAGCGTGGLLLRLAQRAGVSPVGIEYAASAARRARAKSGRPIVAGDVNHLPFAGASFAAAIAADVLCHAAVEPTDALAELHRVLRPGGRLIVNMPAYSWLASAHDARVQNSRRQTVRGLRGLLARAGFLPVSVTYWNGLLLPIMVVQRKVLSRHPGAQSDVTIFPSWLDVIFYAITRFERRLGGSIPAGGSVFAVAVKADRRKSQSPSNQNVTTRP